VNAWPAHVARFVDQWPRYWHTSKRGHRYDNFDRERWDVLFGSVRRAAGASSDVVIIGAIACARGIVHARRMGAWHNRECRMGVHCGAQIGDTIPSMTNALAFRYDLRITCARCAKVVDQMIIRHGMPTGYYPPRWQDDEPLKISASL